MIVGQGPTVLTVGGSRGCSNNFLVSPIVSPSLWKTTRQTKILSKEPLNPN